MYKKLNQYAMLREMISWTSTLLVLHITAAVSGLLLGPVVMVAAKKKGLHTKSGRFYYYIVSFVCISAAVLAILNWQQAWFLFLIAVFCYSCLAMGYRAASRRKLNWRRFHISGMIGSYSALVTVALVVAAKMLGFL
jgi:uncharacterized membrane protein